MILPLKKVVLSGFITLFVCFTAYAVRQTFDLGHWSDSTPLHKCDPTTHTHETSVTHHANYDKYVDSCINNETKDYIHEQYIAYHNETNDCDLNSSSHTINNHDSATVSRDPLSDSALETRRQGLEENQTAQIGARNNDFPANGKIICELLIPKNKIVYLHEMEGRTFDSTIMLEKTHTIKELIEALKSPIIKARFERIKRGIESRNIPKKGRDHPFKEDLKFLDLLISGRITELLEQIQNPDLNIAQAAFDELKQLWPWKRSHTFLGDALKYGTGEPGFITVILNVDLMKIAEKSLITRQDYIAKHANAQEQKIIQEYREKCYMLQQKGNSSDLFSQKQQLHRCINASGGTSDLTANVCLAVVENCWLDPITKVFHSIVHEPSLEKACGHLKSLEKQIIIQAEQHGIIPMSEIRTWAIKHYGFDVLDAAQNCYKSRPDYVYTPDNQSYLSDTIKPILHNIESKDLPQAHAELVHLEKQIDKALAERNITDPIAQKEYINKSLGRDVLELAHKKYEARSDHKKLVESFMAIDVNQAAIKIVENNNSYESVANEMSNLADHVFVNAHHCNLRNLPQIKSHVYDSIDAMRIAQDHPTFIFNFSMVSHTLGDIQQIAHAILSGKHPVLERSSELLTIGLGSFIKGLNPITQIANIGRLIKDTVVGGYYIFDDTLDVALHSNPMEQKNFFLKWKAYESLVNAGRFASDLILGSSYLTPEEYAQRNNAFWKSYDSTITAENGARLTGQILADCIYGKGFQSLCIYLKEIDAASKMEKQIAKVAETFKEAIDTHLAKNPILITAEGVPVKMPEAMHNINNGGGGKNIINSSRALLESEKTGLLSNFKKELDALKKAFGTHRYGFAESKYQKVQLPYEHIFTLEGLGWSKKERVSGLGGFHHDLNGAVKKSGTVQFIERGVEKNGCYLVELLIDGSRIPNKTFFPQHWSREEVVRKIGEAYDDFINKGAIIYGESGGKYIIRGVTQESIEIEMFITKNGQITTAYPIVKPGV